MIKIIKENNTIKVSGHANYADYGKDIVCASVSCIIYTTLNGIEKLVPSSLKVIDNKDMIIEINSKDEIVIKLINNMLELLKNLEVQYPNNIKVKEN